MLEPRHVEWTAVRFHAFLSYRFVLSRKRVMDITVKASHDAYISEDIRSSCIGFASSALPKVQLPTEETNSHIGVSTRNVVSPSEHWYALRTTYGREKKAYDFIIKHNCQAFYPTITTEKVINGNKKFVEVSRLPNIFFAYGTEETIKSFVYDNYNLPFLRFYYKRTHVGSRIEKTPLIVPDSQIKSLRIICNTNVSNDVLFFHDEEKKFKTGQKVRVKEGDFSGVEGIVARFQGQQRVGIVIEGLLTAITAYIPTAFLEKL